MNVCFEEYVMPVSIGPADFERRFRSENVDAEASAVWVDDEGPVAIALIARRGWTSRLAAMGIAKRWRRRGVGRFVVTTIEDEARARGDRAMRLEVIQQNTAAIALYESLGFRQIERLIGWEHEPVRPEAIELTSVDVVEATRLQGRWHCDPVNWMIEPETLANRVAPAEGVLLANACVALVQPVRETHLVLWSLVTDPDQRRQGWARHMLAALAHRFGSRTLILPPIFAERLGADFFRAVDFKESAISQFEMEFRIVE